MEGLFTVEEAAKYTRLSTKTLYTYASQKKIPHIKLGSRLLFDEVKLEEWIRGNAVPMKGSDTK
ncbi:MULTISPECIES: helix-turn-helix domain-containing protein [unclassified Oceanispirochaeta]|nr:MULTISPECIES: helix-turn-helix domain-containing protein [unclassified Oceanispirochaeta]MBF9018617.1 helix-turn-helix domain-containing protein [Oceanispirochaeta sp. M2]NPD75054.1 helix-turn-helix domain-containing protein [Oceanispirochaeta sp. M1]